MRRRCKCGFRAFRGGAVAWDRETWSRDYCPRCGRRIAVPRSHGFRKRCVADWPFMEPPEPEEDAGESR